MPKEELKLMTADDQSKIVAAVKSAIDAHAGDGVAPNTAIAKAAFDAGLNDNCAQLMIESFNTAKTLQHMRTQPAEKRADAIAVADAKGVLSELHAMRAKAAGDKGSAAPEAKTASAVHALGMQLPAFDKAAAVSAKVLELGESPRRPEVSSAFGVAFNKISALLTEARRYDIAAAESKFAMESAVEKIAGAMKTSGANWPRFRAEAEALYKDEPGEALATAVLDKIGSYYHCDGVAKRHGKVAGVVDKVVDTKTDAHTWLKAAVDAGVCAADAMAKSAELREAHKVAKAAVLALGKSEAGGSSTTKTAVGLGELAGIKMISDFANPGANQQPQQQQAPGMFSGARPFDTSTVDSLNAEINKARVGMAMRDLMSEDAVIAQHASEDPEKVTTAIRELTRVSPKLLDMPMALGAAVRRHLELGATEPFELAKYREFSEPLDNKKARQ